jgi:hypothetical protein
LPTLTIANFNPPATSTGVALVAVSGGSVPLPSQPVPQQYASPVVVTPQVWTFQVLIVAKRSPPATGIGVVELWMSPPVPSWPELFSPQQYAAPVVVRPHVW